MRTPRRFSIGGLMGIVLAAAVGLAALKNPSPARAGAILLLTGGVLALAVVGAISRRGAERAWWLGIALFGWGYLALWWHLARHPTAFLPTTGLLKIVGPWLGVAPRTPGELGTLLGMGSSRATDGGVVLEPSYVQVGHCVFALLAALLGSLLATICLPPSSHAPDRSRGGVPEAGRRPRRSWLPPTALGLVVVIGVAAAASLRSKTGGPLWAAIAFAMTWALVGLAILAAALGRGRHRSIGLGAALFGAGYMASIFGRPAGEPPRAYLPADRMLEALRPWLPPVPGGASRRDVQILEALERPIPMRFADATRLEDLLIDVQQRTATATYPGIPIYADPVGFYEAGRTLWWTVEIDLEGVPLRETLRICLKQLDLGYEVRDGRLRITGAAEVPEPALEDPFLIVGHCLLALLVAGLGAAAATVAEARIT